MKTSSSGGGCLVFRGRSPSSISGAVSVLSSLTMIMVSLYLLINTTAFNLVTRSLSDWLRQHNRDKEVDDVEILKSEILVFYLLLIITFLDDGHCPLLHGAAPPPTQACPLWSDCRCQSPPYFFHSPPRSNDLQNLQISYPPMDDVGHDCHNNPSFHIWGRVLPLILSLSAGRHTFPLPGWSHSGRQVWSLYRVLPDSVVSLRQYQAELVDTGDSDGARRKMSNIADLEEFCNLFYFL